MVWSSSTTRTRTLDLHCPARGRPAARPPGAFTVPSGDRGGNNVADGGRPTTARRRPPSIVRRPMEESVMKIAEIRSIPLLGRTPEGGWDHEVAPEENLHTLIEVVADEGLVGVGSCYTSRALAEGALGLLRPWCVGDSAIEPERVTEKLRQMAFWQGRGGAVEHAISGIDIALWDLLGKATGQPVARLLGGSYRNRIKPYGSVLFDEPGRLRDKLQGVVARGFRAIKLGWRPFGRVDRRTDELLV